MAVRSKIRLAESLADSVPPPPDSGVRESVNRIAVAPLAPLAPLKSVAPRPSLPPPLPTASLLASPPKLAIRPLAPAVPYAPPPALVEAAPSSPVAVAVVAAPYLPPPVAVVAAPEPVAFMAAPEPAVAAPEPAVAASELFVTAPEPAAVEPLSPPVVSGPVAIAMPSAPITDRLSYAIYSAAELESHIVESQRMLPPPVVVPGWPDLKTAGGDAGQGLLSWWRLPKPRPRVMDVAGPQLTTLAKVTKAVLATVPWRRLATVTGMVFGVVALLLFAVITVGELTDDVKPGKHTEESLAMKAPAPVATAPAPVETAAPAPTTFEVIQAAPAAIPAPKAAAAKKRRVKRPAPAGPDHFVP